MSRAMPYRYSLFVVTLQKVHITESRRLARDILPVSGRPIVFSKYGAVEEEVGCGTEHAFMRVEVAVRAQSFW
jgi:hypothetical protein